MLSRHTPSNVHPMSAAANYGKGAHFTTYDQLLTADAHRALFDPTTPWEKRKRDFYWNRWWEGQANHPLRRNKYHHTILDLTTKFIRHYATCSNLKERRYIQIGFQCWTQRSAVT